MLSGSLPGVCVCVHLNSARAENKCFLVPEGETSSFWETSAVISQRTQNVRGEGVFQKHPGCVRVFVCVSLRDILKQNEW